MLCNHCLKDVNGKDIICKSCFNKELKTGDRLAIKLTKEIEKVIKLKEEFKKYKKSFN